jgi:hypothetical protein
MSNSVTNLFDIAALAAWVYDPKGTGVPNTLPSKVKAEQREVQTMHIIKRVFWPLFLGTITMSLVTTSCGGLGNHGPESSIVTDREVVLQGINGEPHVITRTPDGTFVIAGVRGIAWAVGVNTEGNTIWKFEEPVDVNVKTVYQSDFKDAVPLDNGNILLCGQITTPEHILALMTILDSRGQVAEQHHWLPEQDHGFFSSSFRQCLRWGDGFAMLGDAVNGREGYLWFVKLDKHGTKEWELLNTELAGSRAVEASDNRFVLETVISGAEETRVFQVNQNLDVMARRSIKSSGSRILRPIEKQHTIKLLTYHGKGQPILYTLNGDLQDIETAKPIPQIVIDPGCGYVLPDKSLALFGYVQRGGGAFTAPYTAAVARIDGDGSVNMRILGPDYKSFTIRDAIPIATNRFVAVREAVGANGGKQGILMSWMTVN